MKLVKESAGPLCVIHVEEDRIDASVAIQFKDAFRELVNDEPGGVLLDLAKVQFLDSSGLGAVVAARKLLGGERSLELAALSPAVDKVMTLTRMNSVFAIHDSVADAMAAHGISADG